MTAQKQQEFEARAKDEILSHEALKSLFEKDWARIQNITITKKDLL